MLAKESIVNKLEESRFVLVIIFFTAANYWFHKELFSFFSDGGIIPSVKLFGVFGQEQVFKVFSETSKDSFDHLLDIECFFFFFWDGFLWIV